MALAYAFLDYEQTAAESDTGRRTPEVFAGVFQRFLETATGEARLRVFDELQEVLQACGEPNADGYGSEPAEPSAIERAWRLAETLPLEMPKPEIVVEPDGDVAFEWSNGSHGTVVVSLDDSDRVLFSSVFGTDSFDGTVSLAGSFPAEVRRLISRLYAVEQAVGPLQPTEDLARYVLEESKLRRGLGRVRWEAFMPHRDGTTSVFRIAGLSVAAIWEFGRSTVAEPQGRVLYGWGEFGVATAVSTGLTVDPDDNPERHASLTDWPAEKQKRRTIAMQLADVARLVCEE